LVNMVQRLTMRHMGMKVDESNNLARSLRLWIELSFSHCDYKSLTDRRTTGRTDTPSLGDARAHLSKSQ